MQYIILNNVVSYIYFIDISYAAKQQHRIFKENAIDRTADD